MKTYAKGAFYERELLHFLNSKGFAVIRAPSSGGNLSPVDIVAIKKGLVIAIESKAWENKPKLPHDRIQRLKEWSDKAGAITFLGWRTKNKWLFLQLKDVLENRYEDEYWIGMENFLTALDFR